MLNHSPIRRAPIVARGVAKNQKAPAQALPDLFSSDWCVGTEAVRWDIPFTIRLFHELKRLLRRKEMPGGAHAPAAVVAGDSSVYPLLLITAGGEAQPRESLRQAA